MNPHGSPKFSSPNARGGNRRAPSSAPISFPQNPLFLGLAMAGELYFFLGLHAGISVLVAALLVLRFKLHFLKIAIVGVPCWVVLGYIFGVGLLGRVAAAAIEAPLLWILHELLRPTQRDRNLLPQGFEDPTRPGALTPFPTLEQPPSLKLSIILPVSCEAEWVASAASAILRSLQARRNCAPGPDSSFELIIVDRASTDSSYAAALSLVEANGLETVRAIRLSQDHGVGRALREGALRARGEQIMLLLHPAANSFDQVEAVMAEMDWLRSPDREKAVLVGTTTNAALSSIADRAPPGDTGARGTGERHGWQSGWTRVWITNLPRTFWDLYVKMLFPSLAWLSGTQWAFALIPRMLFPFLAWLSGTQWAFVLIPRRVAPAVFAPECHPALAAAWPVELLVRLQAKDLSLLEVPVMLSPGDLRRAASPIRRTLQLMAQLIAVSLLGGLVPNR